MEETSHSLRTRLVADGDKSKNKVSKVSSGLGFRERMKQYINRRRRSEKRLSVSGSSEEVDTNAASFKHRASLPAVPSCSVDEANSELPSSSSPSWKRLQSFHQQGSFKRDGHSPKSTNSVTKELAHDKSQQKTKTSVPSASLSPSPSPPPSASVSRSPSPSSQSPSQSPPPFVSPEPHTIANSAHAVVASTSTSTIKPTANKPISMLLNPVSASSFPVSEGPKRRNSFGQGPNRTALYSEMDDSRGVPFLPLREVIDIPQYRHALSRFMKKNLCDENLEFLLACESYTQLFELSRASSPVEQVDQSTRVHSFQTASTLPRTKVTTVVSSDSKASNLAMLPRTMRRQRSRKHWERPKLTDEIWVPLSDGSWRSSADADADSDCNADSPVVPTPIPISLSSVATVLRARVTSSLASLVSTNTVASSTCSEISSAAYSTVSSISSPATYYASVSSSSLSSLAPKEFSTATATDAVQMVASLLAGTTVVTPRTRAFAVFQKQQQQQQQPQQTQQPDAANSNSSRSSSSSSSSSNSRKHRASLAADTFVEPIPQNPEQDQVTTLPPQSSKRVDVARPTSLSSRFLTRENVNRAPSLPISKQAVEPEIVRIVRMHTSRAPVTASGEGMESKSNNGDEQMWRRRFSASGLEMVQEEENDDEEENDEEDEDEEDEEEDEDEDHEETGEENAESPNDGSDSDGEQDDGDVDEAEQDSDSDNDNDTDIDTIQFALVDHDEAQHQVDRKQPNKLLQVSEDRQRMIAKAAKSIFDRFIEADSLRMVNLDASTRDEIAQSIQAGSFHRQLFSRAHGVVFDMVNTDVYKRFLVSDEYDTMIFKAGSSSMEDISLRGSHRKLRSFSVVIMEEDLTVIQAILNQFAADCPKIRTRRCHLRAFKSSFKGSHLVKWLVDHKYAINTPAAVALGQRMIDAMLFAAVEGASSSVIGFRDSPDSLYTLEPTMDACSAKDACAAAGIRWACDGYQRVSGVGREAGCGVAEWVLVKGVRYNRFFAVLDSNHCKLLLFRDALAQRPLKLVNVKNASFSLVQQEDISYLHIETNCPSGTSVTIRSENEDQNKRWMDALIQAKAKLKQ